MLTLNQIVSQITNLAAAHNQIAESGVGDFAEWQAKERSYPILWVFHESTSVNQMEIAFSIRLICADRVIVGEEGDNTEGHEQEVISDTLLVLLDFLAYFQQNHSQPYNVVTSATIDPFTERLNDRLAGNSVTIQIRQPFDWNKCQIPQSGASIPPSVDGLTLYNFCDPAVIARLTPAQVACLQSEYALPADITINSAPFGTAPSGGTFDVPVVNNGSNPVGSEQSGEWVIGNSTVTINGTQVGDIVAEDTLPIAVELDGNPSGVWNAGTQTWEVTSTPCADATFSIDGVQVDTVASGADLDVSVELNGSPVTPTYNSGTKVIGVTGGVSGSIAVAVSDATPDFGQTITITATPSGFAPSNYYFFARQGSALTQLAPAQVGNVLNWNVNILGTFSIFVQANDATVGVFNVGGESATSVPVVITTNIELWLDPFISNIVAPSYPDISGFARNGTLVNAPTVVVGSLAANDGGYIGLNGVNQYIGSIGTVADFAFVQNTLQFSMGGFFYIGSTSAFATLIVNSVQSAFNGFSFGYRGDTTKHVEIFIVNGGTGYNMRTVSNAITSIGWYHIFVTYNGEGTAIIYINGVASAMLAPTGTYTPTVNNSANVLRIGNDPTGFFFMNGRIGPVQIYNVTLSATQVLTNFNADRSRYGL